MKFEQKDIVLVPFPYTDLTYIKKRPVVIISNNSFNNKNDDVLVAVITSKTFYDDFSVEIDNDSLEYGMLPEKSIIKTSKLFTINKNLIIKKFSKLTDEKFNQIVYKINDFISLKK